MRRFTLDTDKCVGCRTCELACSFSHRQQFDPESAKIRIYFCDDGGLDIRVAACDCRQPLCLEMCPTQALRPTLLCRAIVGIMRLCSRPTGIKH
jgi:anaerobic carbon-monoxide dehydrogenase iron sulfur subunit